MPMMSDLIEALIRRPDDAAVRAALADALSVTGPVIHQGIEWITPSANRILGGRQQLWQESDAGLALCLRLPLAIHTPIPR